MSGTYDDTDQVAANEDIKESTRMKREEAVSFFKSQGIDVEYHESGMLVGGRIVFSPKSYKWRNLGKGKWYRSKGPEHLYSLVFSHSA